MAHTALTAPSFIVADLPTGERNFIGLARVSTDAQDAQLQRGRTSRGRVRARLH